MAAECQMDCRAGVVGPDCTGPSVVTRGSPRKVAGVENKKCLHRERVPRFGGQGGERQFK